VANNFSVREEAASKIGSFGMCCFETLIAARPAMGGSFALATAIITRNNCTTTLKPNRFRRFASLFRRLGIVLALLVP
jgi:hypothetical protein